MDNLEGITAHQDSIIANYVKAEALNEDKFLLAEERIKQERKRANKFRRQRNLLIVADAIVIGLVGYALIK